MSGVTSSSLVPAGQWAVFTRLPHPGWPTGLVATVGVKADSFEFDGVRSLDELVLGGDVTVQDVEVSKGETKARKGKFTRR